MRVFTGNCIVICNSIVLQESGDMCQNILVYKLRTIDDYVFFFSTPMTSAVMDRR